VLVTLKLHWGSSVALAATGKKPESKNLVGSEERLEHGLANEDWVTVWSLAAKVKAMVSPTKTLLRTLGV